MSPGGPQVVSWADLHCATCEPPHLITVTGGRSTCAHRRGGISGICCVVSYVPQPQGRSLTCIHLKDAPNTRTLSLSDPVPMGLSHNITILHFKISSHNQIARVKLLGVIYSPNYFYQSKKSCSDKVNMRIVNEGMINKVVLPILWDIKGVLMGVSCFHTVPDELYFQNFKVFLNV